MRALILIPLLLLGTSISFARPSPANSSQSSSCNSLTGSWSGSFTDQYKLFYNGGPWPIIMRAYYANGRFIGIITSGNNKVPPQGGYIWGECKDNQLTNIKVRENARSCNSNSTGSLTSTTTLNITYNWQNPAGMMGTTFNMALNKTNSNPPGLGNNKFLKQYLETGTAPVLRECK